MLDKNITPQGLQTANSTIQTEQNSKNHVIMNAQQNVGDLVTWAILAKLTGFYRGQDSSGRQRDGNGR